MLWRTVPTLMMEKYQNTLEEINEKYVKEHGIEVVRRMSGGGCIYNDFERMTVYVYNPRPQRKN